MAKKCPITNGPALYLTCLECDDKQCENIPVKFDPLAKKPIIVFSSGEDMYEKIRLNDYELYSENTELYVFPYNNRGAVAYYHIDKKRAIELEKAASETDEYWGALLGPGGCICDAPDDEPVPDCSALDFCNEHYQDGWIIVNREEV